MIPKALPKIISWWTLLLSITVLWLAKKSVATLLIFFYWFFLLLKCQVWFLKTSFSVIFFLYSLSYYTKMLKGIVHPKMKMWCLSAYPQGIQDVGDFSSVEHKRRFLTQTVAVCQSYNGNQCPTLLSSSTTSGVWRVTSSGTYIYIYIYIYT